ncbi:hypothetical protein N9263_00065 [Candidatus Marinimicrobia bacterium]|nr:hypothetical protein [Candidatus Neomarinimicrobiota bacterium]
MNISNNFGFKIPNNISDECEGKNLVDQINFLNLTIFEDIKIDHGTRLQRQSELLAYSDSQGIDLSSAYILNLISQTNIQLGKLSVALDCSIKAKSKWELVKREENGLAGLILCYSDIGQIYMKMGLIDESMGFFEDGLNLLNDSDELFVPFFKIHYHLSEVYADLNFTSKAHEMINTGIDRINSFMFGDKNRKYIYLTPSMIILGNLYAKDNPTLAIEHYSKALKMCNYFSDVIYKQKIYYSLGIEYFKLKDLNRSEEYLLKAEKLYESLKGDARLINIKLGLYDIHIEKNKIKSAHNHLMIAKTLAEKNTLNKELIKIYERLSNYAEITNDMENGFLYNKKHIELIANYYNSKNQALINEKRETVLELSNAIKEKNELNITKNIEFNKKINLKSRILRSLYTIKEKNILNSIQTDLRQIINSTTKNKEEIFGLLNKIDDYNYKESSWKDFELLFIQSHEDFIIKLKRASQNLTSKQIRFCMFIKMGMDNYDICNLLNVSSRAIEQQRYRIKKKLKISENLDDYLAEL